MVNSSLKTYGFHIVSCLILKSAMLFLSMPMTLTATSQFYRPYNSHYPLICHVLEILHKPMYVLHSNPFQQVVMAFGNQATNTEMQGHKDIGRAPSASAIMSLKYLPKKAFHFTGSSTNWKIAVFMHSHHKIL